MTTTSPQEKTTVTLNAEVPPTLYRKMNDLLAVGEFTGINNFVTIALTYYISTHRIGHQAEKEF
jgi:hypothetical protein